MAIIPVKLGKVRCFIIKQSKTILIDSGYPKSEARILDALRENSIGPGDVSLIVITHGHLDHFGSAALLKEMLKCPIAMHRSDASAGETGESVSFQVTTGMGKLILPLISGKDKEYYYSFKPDIIIEDELDLWHYGIRGKIVTTPGHSAGSVSVVLDSGEAVISDLLIGGGIIRKKAKLPLYYDSVVQTKASVKKLLALGAKKFYISHGRMLTEKEVRKFIGET